MIERQHVTSVDGTQLAYELHGDGPPLISGTGAICHREFRPVPQGAAQLGRIARVVSYDRRGRGDSGDADTWSLERELDDISALIDAVGGQAFLYGHSSGAVLALYAARRFPGKVTGVLAYDASWVADDAQAQDYAVLRGEVERLLDARRDARAVQRCLGGVGMPALLVWLLPLWPGPSLGRLMGLDQVSSTASR